MRHGGGLIARIEGDLRELEATGMSRAEAESILMPRCPRARRSSSAVTPKACDYPEVI